MPPKFYVKFIERKGLHYAQIFNEGCSDLIFEINIHQGWKMNKEEKERYLKSVLVSVLKDVFDVEISYTLRYMDE